MCNQNKKQQLYSPFNGIRFFFILELTNKEAKKLFNIVFLQVRLL